MADVKLLDMDATLEAIEKVQVIEAALTKLPQVHCPVEHIFEPGKYIREIFMPAGALVTGAIHKHAHYNHIIKGKVIVFTRDESDGVMLEAPCSWESQPCIKRAVLVLEDCIWRTVHDNPTNTTDIDKLVEMLTFSTNDELFGGSKNKQALYNASLSVSNESNITLGVMT